MGSVMPFVVYYAGAALVPLARGRLRKTLALLFPAIAFVNILFILPQRSHAFHFSGFEVILFHADRLNLFLAYVLSFTTVLISVFTINIKGGRHYAFMFIYVGSAMGILFSGDFLSLYLFWEVMMVAAVVLIALSRDKPALKAAYKYLVMHLAGGGILLAGILLHYHYSGSMLIEALDGGMPFMLILCGIGLNAAFLPVHTWLPDAYSRSAFPSALILSVFTTKIAVYALARIVPGTESLMIMGVAMALFGSIYALFRTDARQILSYLMISSLGYMIAGIGVGGTEGINAAMLYAWNHIQYNTLLFMSVGTIMHCTGKQEMDVLGGLIRKMPFAASGLVIGAFALAGLPLFSGFISKSLIYEALHDFPAAYQVLKLASFLIMLSAVRFAHAVLFGRSAAEVREAPKPMVLSVLLIAASVIAGGAVPHIFSSLLPYDPGSSPRAGSEGIVETLALASAAAVFFAAANRFVKAKNLRFYDIDHLYELISKEALLFAKDPVFVASSWIDLFCAFAHNSRARLFGSNREHDLSAAEKYAEHARQKRTRVSVSSAAMDLVTIGSSLFLITIVVMIFLLFMVFRKT